MAQDTQSERIIPKLYVDQEDVRKKIKITDNSTENRWVMCFVVVVVV